MPATVIEWLHDLVSRWETTELRVRQDGKVLYLPLSRIQDQAVVARYVADKLAIYRADLKRQETETAALAEQEKSA